MDTKVKNQHDTVNDVIGLCKIEFDRIEKIIEWLRAEPVKEGSEINYRLIRRLKNIIFDAKEQIRMIETKEGKYNELAWIEYLQKYQDILVKTYLVIDISDNS